MVTLEVRPTCSFSTIMPINCIISMRIVISSLLSLIFFANTGYFRTVSNVAADAGDDAGSKSSKQQGTILNHPPAFLDQSSHFGKLIDVTNDAENMTFFEKFVDTQIARTDGLTDGEIADVIEHYFWGKRNGLAMELGALDGSPKTRSMTYELENSLEWHRILVEGDPRYRENLKKNSPGAFSVNSAICEKHAFVHFRQADYVGGILEFMGPEFVKNYHADIYNAGTPPGNLSSINWDILPSQGVLVVECLPLQWILHKAFARHVNFFILDVEGGELEVLKSINWNHTRFDVLCIETEESNRPAGYTRKVIDFMADRGYHNRTVQQGRNIWFLRRDFQPSSRPGISPDCFNGARKSIRDDTWFTNRRTPPFQKCPKV